MAELEKITELERYRRQELELMQEKALVERKLEVLNKYKGQIERNLASTRLNIDREVENGINVENESGIVKVARCWAAQEEERNRKIEVFMGAVKQVTGIEMIPEMFEGREEDA